MSAYEKQLLEERAKANAAAREILDRAASEGRGLTSEEEQSVDRAFAEIDEKGRLVETMRAAEARDAEIREAMENAPELRAEERRETPESQNDEQILRKLNMGEIRSFDFERRDVSTSSTGAPVPTDFYGRVITLLRDYSGPYELGMKIVTAGGADIQFPRTSAYSTGSVTAEGGHMVESDPTFSAFVTLGAHKQTVFFQTTRELFEDNGVDMMGYLSLNFAQGLGYNINTDLTVGVGTTEPTGVVTAAGSALTSGTSGTFEYNDIVDLYYSLDPAVRQQPKFAFMASTGGVKRLRKLADTTGQPLWQPSLIAGQPDSLFGKPIYENVAMADIGAGNLPVIAGDFGSYIIRQVGGVRIERSDDFAFDYDLTTWKATLRLDANLPQTSHIKYLRCAL